MGKICASDAGPFWPSWPLGWWAWGAMCGWCRTAVSVTTPRGSTWGGACGITGAGLGLLMRNEWMLRHPEKWKRARIQETDERSQRIVAQAAQLAGVGVFFLQALAAFVLVAVDRRLVTVLLCSMAVYVLLFLGGQFGLSRKL